jgi:hypothetical protein
MTKNTKHYYDLWNKDINIDFDPDEFAFLKKQIKNKKFTITYGFYNKVSAQKKQIVLIINTDPFMTRRTGVENNWEYITTRDITDLEIEEYINFYFRSSYKRFWVFYYRDIERLIVDDLKLKTITPPVFIKMCQDKGYEGKYQTRLEFN